MNALLIATALLLAGEDAAKADLEKLQGIWQLVAMEAEGDAMPADELGDRKAVYEGNRLSLRSGETVRRRGIITLNPSRSPKAMNTWDQDGPYQDQTVPGIYELEGDTLKICFARPGQERPKTFTTKMGTGVLYCVYKRQKP